jgi:predicted P-loop ATPase/GTPase
MYLLITMLPIFHANDMLYKYISIQNNVVEFLIKIQMELLSSHKGFFLLLLFFNFFVVFTIHREMNEYFFLISEQIDNGEKKRAEAFNRNCVMFEYLNDQIESITKNTKKIKKLQYVK